MQSPYPKGLSSSVKTLKDKYFIIEMFKNEPILASFCVFSSFPHYNFNNKIDVDGVLGIQTCSRMMVGTDNTKELWRPPFIEMFLLR